MKLSDALKQKGRPFEIPDCSRDDLPQFFVEMGFKLGAEIGVDQGVYTEKLCKAGLTVYGIDPWLAYEDYIEIDVQKRIDERFNTTKNRLKPYPNARIIRKTSMEAAENIADRSLDFVYIDGNHQLMHVIQDLTVWSKKVKIGGIIAGHDYIYTNPKTIAGICHVIPAVHAYVDSFKIENWYLLGRKHAEEGEKRDRFRSWMFVNQDFKYRED